MQVSTDKVMSSCCLQQQRSGKLKDNRKGEGIVTGQVVNGKDHHAVG
jgi:hypothetical protein